MREIPDMGKQDAGNLRPVDVLWVLAAKRVEESPQLGGLRVHPRRLSNVLHTYYFTKSFQRHGQKIIIYSKLNSGSIMVIFKSIEEIVGDFGMLGHTACYQSCQTCISTK